MALPPHLWSQVKNLTAAELRGALERDGYVLEGARGAVLGFYKAASPPRRVTIHFHPQKTYGPKLLQALLKDAGWTEEDLRRLKLVK